MGRRYRYIGSNFVRGCVRSLHFHILPFFDRELDIQYFRTLNEIQVSDNSRPWRAIAYAEAIWGWVAGLLILLDDTRIPLQPLAALHKHGVAARCKGACIHQPKTS